MKSGASDFFKITLLSLPNFFEAIIGILTLTGVILLMNDRLNKKYQVGPKIIYIIAVALAAMYVILQELNIINIRTNTTFDQNDLIFSAIGLVIGYLIILLVKPRIRLNSEIDS